MTTGAGDAREPRVYAALAGMCLIWGSTFLVIRIGNEALPPAWAAALRLLIAIPLYFGVACATGASVGSRLAVRGALLYGSLNYGVNFVLLYWGELRVSSGPAAVIYATIPLTTAVFAWMSGVHRLEWRQLVASAIGLAGVAAVFSSELVRGVDLGALLAVAGAATASSLASVVLKRTPPQSTWVTNGFGAIAGVVVCLAASASLGERWRLPGSAASWGPILYLVVAGNLGAYALYGWVVTRWNVVRINVIALIIPIIAVALGTLVRHEALGRSAFAGAALVLVGVSLSLFWHGPRQE